METHPLIDRSQLEKYANLGGGELIRKLIDVFLVSTPKRIHPLRLEQDQRIMKDMAFAAHSLKSSSGNLGARELQFLCEDLEMIAAHGGNGDAGTAVERLLECYERTCEALKTERTKALP